MSAVNPALRKVLPELLHAGVSHPGRMHLQRTEFAQHSEAVHANVRDLSAI